MRCCVAVSRPSLTLAPFALLFLLLSLLLLGLAPGALAQAPTAPTNVSATARSAQAILSWTASTGATSYTLYRSTVAGGEGTTAYKSGITTAYYVDTAVTNGIHYYYKVAAVNSSGTSPQSSEVSATPLATLTSFYLNCGGPTYTDSSGNNWAADYAYVGGTPTSTTSTITGSSDPTLYQAQRAGTSFSYQIPLPNGNYVLGLRFAEIEGKTTGQRVFNVSAGSQSLLKNFDIYAATGGGLKTIYKTFSVPVTGGKLTLSLTGVTGSATVAGIQLSSIPATGGIIYGTPSGYSTGAADVPPPGWAEDAVPTDSGADADGQGPSDGLTVSLPSGAAEDAPGPDVWSYNPLGPSASYSRLYRSSRAATGYESPGLSAGWTDNYDEFVTFGGSSYTLTYPNGGQDVWNGTTGTLTIPTGVSYPYTLVQTPGSPATITLTDKSRTKLTFTQFATAAGNYPANTYLLTKITNLVGHSITINRDTGSANGHHITSIVNDAATPQTLLAFVYASGLLSSVTDTANSRKAAYTFSGGNLATVSQIVVSTATSPPSRWVYGYTTLGSQPYLTLINCPNPAAPGGAMTPAYVDYYSSGSVGIIFDSGGRIHYYAYGGVVQVQELLPNVMMSETHQQKFSATKNVNTGITDAFGHSTTVAYSGTPSPYLPSAFTNRNNQTSSLTYDTTGAKYGNVGATVDPRRVQTAMGYQYPTDFPLGQVTSVQESNLTTGATKQATTMSYFDGTAGTTNPGGAFNGLVKEVDTPAPDTVDGTTTIPTTYAYDTTLVNGNPLGNVSVVTSPGPNSTLGTSSTYTTTTYAYTNGIVTVPALGEPVSVTVTGQAPSGGPSTINTQTTTFTYNTQGDVLSSTDASGYETDYQYNIADQCISVISPITNTQGSGHAHTDTTYQYVGGPVQKVVVYDEAGTAVREVDYAYTHEGTVASVTGSTQPVSYTYDERYRPLTMTDGNSHTTSYDYDPIGNLLDMKYPLASGQFDTTTYTYDNDQNLLTQVDGRGVTTTYTRNVDPESLVTKVTYSTLPGSVTPIQPVNYTYDDFGRRKSMNDGDGTMTGSYSYTYGYDDLDELLSQTVSFTGGPQNQTLSFAHNNDSSRASLTTPGSVSNPLTINAGKFGYTYDGVGRLAQINVPFTTGGINGTAGDYLQHQYLPNGWLSQTTGLQMNTSSTPRPSTTTYYNYNARGFLNSLNNYQYNYTDGASELTSSFSGMTYDALGNRLKQTAVVYGSGSAPDASRQVTFTYDTAHSPASTNRDVLTEEKSILYDAGSAAYNDVYDNPFGYDAAYNPTAFALGGTALSLPVNNDNQINLGGFSFDGSGNPTTYQSATFGFDPEDRLTSISSPAFSAAYDADGLRIKKTAASVTTYYLYDGGSPVVEETWNGSAASLSAVNVASADGWRSRYYVGGQFYSFSFDPQGNVVQKQYGQNFGPAPYSLASFEAYGRRGGEYDNGGHSPALHQDPAGFGGQYGYYTDTETGLLCLTHRYYDPGTGKFINRDPIGYAGGANLYGFADDNPVNESDPNGFQGKGDPDQCGLPDDGDLGMKTAHPGMHAGTAQSNTARAMSRSLVSTLIMAGLGVVGGAGGKAEEEVVSLTAKQRGLLSQLAHSGSEALMHKRAASMSDLRNLTIHTGDEFAMFTRGSQRLIIRGIGGRVAMTEARAVEMAQAGWRFSGHTHTPGYAPVGSIGDINILRAFGQVRSGIWATSGRIGRFYKDFFSSLTRR